MSRTRIKICGVRDAETAVHAAECGADALGLVFVKSSPRFVEPETAWEVVGYLPPFVQTVGLLADASPKQFFDIQERCPLDLWQFHGNEPEPTVRECGPLIIKAIRFNADTIEADLMKWNRIAEVSAVLIDGGSGGEGRAFDWDALARIAEVSDHPIILAGGLTPENVGRAIEAVRPWAVDVSSGVERAPGEKDPGLIEDFCEAVREADASL